MSTMHSYASQRRSRLIGLILILPSLLCFLLVFGIPLINLLSFSLHPYLSPAQVGETFTLENYRSLFADTLILQIMAKTFSLGFCALIVNILLGYPIAYFLARTESRFRGMFFFFVMSPLLISAVVRNLGWFPILSGSGVLNYILTATVLTEPVPFINTFFGVTIALAHALLPIFILTLYTVIQRIDPEIENAAINLGATPLMAFMRVTLPLTRPGLIGGGLLVFSISISAFTTPAVMGGNQVIVMALYIAQQVRVALDYATASTGAVVLLVACVIITVLALRFQKVAGEQT